MTRDHRPGPDPDRILVGQLTGTARHHTRWRELAHDEPDAAVTGLRELADGRAGLLAEVAALTFSEAMRDVDLFIGVTSIGADPGWLDRGEGRRFENYRHRYAFGDLRAGAEVRREVPAGLVPMLAVADRCEPESRFLKVRGDLRTYRIHLEP